MKRNVCGVDRTVRLVVGIVLLAVALGSRGEDRVPIGRILAGYGAAELLLINGTLQWCPLNYLLGVDSCEQDAAEVVASTLGNGVRAVPVPS